MQELPFILIQLHQGFPIYLKNLIMRLLKPLLKLLKPMKLYRVELNMHEATTRLRTLGQILLNKPSIRDDLRQFLEVSKLI